MATFKELLAQAKTPEEKQAVERAFNRNRGRVNDLETAKALGAVGGPKIGGGGSFTVTSSMNNIFAISQAVYGSDRYAEQLARANGWVDSEGNIRIPTLRAGETIKTPIYRTGLAGADIRVSQNFMNAVGGGQAQTVLGATAGTTPTGSTPTTLANQPQANNPNYGGTTLPLQSAGQPLIGDTVRPGAGGNRILQTGTSGVPSPAGTLPSLPSTRPDRGTPLTSANFATASPQLQGGAYSPSTLPANRPDRSPGLPAQSPSPSRPDRGEPLKALGDIQAALQSSPTAAGLQSVYGNTLSAYYANPQAIAWALSEKITDDVQFNNVLNILFPETATQTPTGDDSSVSLNSFTPYEAGVYVGVTERWLKQARRRRELAGLRPQSSRYGQSFAPSPIERNPFSGSIVDRALNWRIGF